MMSLMLKLLAITLLLSSIAQADSSKLVKDFLQKNFGHNPAIKSIDIKVTNTISIKGQRDWKAYFVTLKAVLKKDKRAVSQKMLWFSDGKVVTKELYDLNTGKDLKDLISLPFKNEYYSKANLIYGNANAKHKVAIFSDPLCPFCRKFVPSAIKFMKKEPNKFAIYYYHFPLPGLHPASIELVKAATALEMRGEKDVVLNLYKVKVNPREKSQEKILAAFNETMGSHITIKEMNALEVLQHLARDLDIAEDMMVGGTPTIFFDGKIDKQKNKYKTAK